MAIKRDELADKYSPDAGAVSRDEYIKKLEKENERILKQVGTDETLFEYIRQEIVAMPPLKRVKYDKPKLKHAPVYAALCIADPHAEEHVRPEEMEGLAEYTFKTFLSRNDQTGKKALELVNIMRQAGNINSLSIFSLGDWFCGLIHPQDKGYGVTMPMPVAVPKVGIAFGGFLRGLSAHFDRIDVHCMCGNHGRDTLKPSLKMSADRNWDMSVYLIAQELTSQCENIHWNIPKSIMARVEVAGWGCLLSHSGEVSMSSRTPYYGIERTMQVERNLRYDTDKQFDYAFMGHFHHHAVLDSNIIMCPSMIGDSQFGRYRLHRVSKAEQLLCFFTEKHGLAAQWPIKLT